MGSIIVFVMPHLFSASASPSPLLNVNECPRNNGKVVNDHTFKIHGQRGIVKYDRFHVVTVARDATCSLEGAGVDEISTAQGRCQGLDCMHSEVLFD